MILEYKRGVVCQNRFKPPEGFKCLGKGETGDVFISQHDVVLKFFEDDEAAKTEYAITSHIVDLALQYTAGPVFLFKQKCERTKKEEEKEWCYVMRTKHAGLTLYQRQYEKPLSKEELCLCLMQAIHLSFLLGNEIEVNDIHQKNICISSEGSQIEVRWIDLGQWDLLSSKKYKGLYWNARLLCGYEVWKQFKKPILMRLLNQFINELDIIHQKNEKNQIKSIARFLYAFASKLCNMIMPSASYSKKRAVKLLQEIKLSFINLLEVS